MGRQSAVQLMLDTIATAGLLIFDWQQASQVVQMPAQITVWEKQVPMGAEWAVLEGEGQPGHLAHGAIVDQLTGRSPWLSPQVQLELPMGALMTAAQIRRQAFERMGTLLNKEPSYTLIWQKPGEDFGPFADHLQVAVNSSALPEITMEAVLKDFLQSEATPEYKQVLSALPATATATELIERRVEHGRHQENALLIAALQQVSAAARRRGDQGACFHCRKSGHLRRDCPEENHRPKRLVHYWVCGGPHTARVCHKRQGGLGHQENGPAGVQAGQRSRPESVPNTASQLVWGVPWPGPDQECD